MGKSERSKQQKQLLKGQKNGSGVGAQFDPGQMQKQKPEQHQGKNGNPGRSPGKISTDTDENDIPDDNKETN